MEPDSQHPPPGTNLSYLLQAQQKIATPLRNTEFCISLLKALDPISRLALGRTCRYLLTLARPLIVTAYDSVELFSYWPKRATDPGREAVFDFRVRLFSRSALRGPGGPSNSQQPGSLRREISRSEWEVVDRHARRIQHVEQPVVVQGSFVLFERCLHNRAVPTLPLFPNLISLKLQHKNDSAAASMVSRMLLSPSLEELGLLPSVTPQHRSANGTWTIFHALSQATLPRLCIVRVGNWTTVPPSLLKLALTPFTSTLRVLELRCTSPASDVVNLISSMPLLEDFSALDTVGRATSLSILPLQRLTKLSVDTAMMLAILKATPSLDNIAEVCFTVSDYFGEQRRCHTTMQEVQTCIDLIGEKCRRIQFLWICIPSPILKSKIKLSLLPLSDCRDLIDLRIDAEDRNFALEDADMQVLAQHWLRLQRFASIQIDQRPRASLACVAALSLHCPELESFISPLRHDGTRRRLASFGRLPRLQTLELGEAWIGGAHPERKEYLNQLKHYLKTGEV